MAVVKSRVRDTHKPITSRSALFQADKARETLETAQAILEASDSPYVADALQVEINRLNHKIREYYRNTDANKEPVGNV